jgi:hypothetical protein
MNQSQPGQQDFVLNQSIKERFDAMGFRWFSHQEILDRANRLSTAIQIGVERQGTPVNTDGGVLAIPSHVTAISQDQIAALPEDAVAITATCGGTNWIFTLARKHADGTVILEEALSDEMPESNRTHTFETLMELIADNVARVAKQYNVTAVKNLPIGISFGFPQTNIKGDNGDVDSRITTPNLPKKWVVTDCDPSLPAEQQPSLADVLRAELIERGVQFPGAITIINDTVAVSLDVHHSNDLAVGFVFGTGTNAALYVSEAKGILNLEAGHTPMPVDEVWNEMQRRGYVTENPSFEHWMGGGYLPYRIAAALYLLEDEIPQAARFAEMFINTENQALISHLAEGNFTDLQFAGLSEEEEDLLRSVSRRVLTQAGQVIGIMTAVVAERAGYKQGVAYFPYEGSLMKKGYNVQRTALDTAELLIPGHQLQPYIATGMVGVAKLAMVQTYKHFV